MTKNYQTATASAATVVETQLPDAVSVTLAELAGSLREGLLALAVGTGLQVMEAILDESVTALAGPKGRHDPDRAAVRHVISPKRPHRRQDRRGGGASL